MNDGELPDDEDIEELLSTDSPEHDALERAKKSKKVNPVGAAFYGERFEAFDKIETIRDLLPQFKAHYYAERIRDPKVSGREIMASFNENVAFPIGRTFFPNMTNVKNWRAKWDLDIYNQRKEMKGDETALIPKPMSVKQVIATRGERDEVVLGIPYESIEAGATTLAGELMNDALQMLKDDQQIGEIYDDEVLIKRRNYIVGVLGHVTKLAHGKAALLLKASQEKRENAGFLMTLLARASAGKLSEDEMNSLKTTYSVPVPSVATPAESQPNT